MGVGVVEVRGVGGQGWWEYGVGGGFKELWGSGGWGWWGQVVGVVGTRG